VQTAVSREREREKDKKERNSSRFDKMGN